MPHRRAILIADDSTADIEILNRAFLKAGVPSPLFAVNDGEEAIRYLAGEGEFSDRAKYPFPSLLLLDLKMPRYDGFDVLDWMTKHPKLKRLWVTVFTSSGEPQDVNRAYDLGANSYVVKPGSFDDLTDIVTTLYRYWMKYNQEPDCVPA